jgi:hypothetical protein
VPAPPWQQHRTSQNVRFSHFVCVGFWFQQWDGLECESAIAREALDGNEAVRRDGKQTPDVTANAAPKFFDVLALLGNGTKLPKF